MGAGENVRRVSLGLALALSSLLVVAHHAAAQGALAVGTDGNIAADGVAIGTAFDRPTRDIAVDAALAACRGFKDAPKVTPMCTIIGTFSRECAAVAYDPKAGTPGEGWAIGPDEPTADSRAMAMCQATAGPDRLQFCVIAQSHCDTHD